MDADHPANRALFARQSTVKSGTDAQSAFLEAIDPAIDPTRAAAIRDALLDYCRRDTEAMVQVLAALTR